jgi:hypothetical protein
MSGIKILTMKWLTNLTEELEYLYVNKETI